MPNLRNLGLAFTCSFFLFACGEDAAKDDDANGTGGSSGTGGTGGTGASCNTLANTGPTVEFMQVAEDLPVAEAVGGTLMPGTYHLTSRTVHTGPAGATGPTGETRRQTLVISAEGSSTFIVESVTSNGGGADEHFTFTATLNGTQSTINAICPVQALISTGPYTATATSYTAYDTVEGELDVFMRQ